MRRYYSFVTIIAIALSSMLAGCSDPKAANEGNFTSAINDYMSAGERGRLCFNSVWFPHEINTSGFFMADTPDQQAQLVELVQAGLVRKSQKTVSDPQFFGPPVKRTETVYDLTRLGAAHVSSNQQYAGSQFCFAQLKVGQIVKFTEPNAMMGVTVSDVAWVPAVASMDPWAQQLLDAKKLAFVQRLIDQTTSTQRSQAMDLTNKGWEVAQ